MRSLGIDGGNSYSAQFQDLSAKTLLANQRTTFDIQFSEIAKILMRTRIDCAPLDVQSPVRVYVAATEAQMLAVRVLEYSIRKHASLAVQVSPLHQCGIQIPTPAAPQNCPRTPFSFQRFLIPALTRYQGKAIYLDSDMQVFQDIRRLWNVPLEGADLLAVQEPGTTGRRPQFSVMLLDCGSLRWDIEAIVSALNEGKLTYEQLMYEMAVAPKIRPSLDSAWNSLERYDPGETCLVHYTDMNTQPWLSANNPLGYLWMRDLFEALDGGFLPASEIAEHVRRGFVRPSLLFQVEHRVEDSYLLPTKARRLDQGFVPPFSAAPLQQSSPWLRPSAVLRAAARGYFHSSLFFRAGRRLRSLLRSLSMPPLSLSVALCTYNGSQFLPEQLQSLRSQSRQPDELVVCDDRSSDNTVALVERFAQSVPFRVRLEVNPATLGSTKNFEQAIVRCCGDIIALSDQDDVWQNDKLARLEEALAASHSLGAVFSDADVVDEQLRPLGYTLWDRYGFRGKRQRQFQKGKAFRVLLDRNAATGATLAFRSRLKEWILPIPACWMHDAWIAVVVAAIADLAIIEKPLIQYRQHAQNQIGGRRPKMSEFLQSVFQDNSGFYQTYVTQLKELRQRLAAFPKLKQADDLSRLESRILHFEARALMPSRRTKRLPIALRELWTLRYFRHSNGSISLGKDLFLSRKWADCRA
ncbi:MAG: glycosyltransferase [Acidimicrobiia bacterium]|nr:glycosyltransferase [Acidimicrobiia bacterium]